LRERKEMAKEFLIYGQPPAEMRDNDFGFPSLLNAQARTYKEAQQVAKILEEQHGCTELEIKVFELDGTLPDFAGAVTA
jgi:hypothetical protein